MAIVAVETVVCTLAALPVVLVWGAIAPSLSSTWLRRVLLGAALVPSYVAFALLLIIVSPLAARVTGARTPPRASLAIHELDWALLRWVRYMVAIHLVRLIAGTLFRGSPIWSFYLRLNGAKIGRRVYVNSVFVSDHNLLQIDDDVVIGDGVHLAGHTVERGIVKTAPVKIGQGVTIGLDSIVDIGAELGAGCQVAAMSFVPKYAKLEAKALYGGVPVQRIASVNAGR